MNDTTNETTAADRDFAAQLRDETSAVRLRRRYLGDARTLTVGQREQAAAVFHADPSLLRGRKMIFDRTTKEIRAANSAVDRACDIWRAFTVPYSAAEPGVRLIRRDRIAEFESAMRAALDELVDANAAVEDVYQTKIIPDAQARLGELFNAGDYPSTLVGAWGFDWEYPSIDPPDWLQQLNPALFAQEQARIRARFEEAVAATEAAFVEEFGAFVAKLAERLAPGPDGKAKTFHETTVTNLTEFFDRFRQLNIGSNAELDRLVAEAQGAVQGVTAKSLRTDALQRGTVRESLAAVYRQLTDLMVDRPERRISLDESDE